MNAIPRVLFRAVVKPWRRWCRIRIAAWVGFCALSIVHTTIDQVSATHPIETVHPSDPLTGDFFGNTVAVSGDVLVVGAPFHPDLGPFSGAAYVFRNVAGVWQQEAKLTASGGASNDQFGEYVAISGEWIVVSARRPVSGDGISPGAAYVFRYDGSTWIEAQKLTGEADQDRFGSAVAIDGDVIVVTAIEAHDLAGVAYVYRYTGENWELEQALVDSNPLEINTFFGESAAISGNTIVIGASKDRAGGKKWAGAAYVFAYSPPNWLEQQVLTATDTVQARRFGVAVSVDGDRIAVGAPLHSDTLNLRGAAYLFERSGTTWSQQARIVPEAANQVDYVGRAVALKGNHLVIGAPTSLDNVNGPEPGSVYIYERDSVDWVLIERVFAPDSHPDDFFGNSVALNTERIVAGAIGNDADGMNAGSAYVFSDAVATHVPSGVEFGEILAQNYPNRARR